MQKLSFHLEGKKLCFFKKYANIDEVLEKTENEDSQFTAWLHLNNYDEEARKYLYAEIPAHYT